MKGGWEGVKGGGESEREVKGGGEEEVGVKKKRE